MDASPFGVLLEKTRLPQPLLQRSAVSALFQKLRAAPSHRGFESREGRDAVSSCLNTSLAAVVDQSVREMCSLVIAGVLKVGLALVELQSGLEGCESRFVGLFVKGIGFLCRRSFREDLPYWLSLCQSVELHPFVRALSCRSEVQDELRRQVLLFILQNRSSGMEVVSDFIRPFVIFSILSIQTSSQLLKFAEGLVSDLASLCCSLSTESMEIMRLLTGSLQYFPSENEEEFRCLTTSAECMVDAFEVTLKQMMKPGRHGAETLIFRVELLENLLSICTELHKPYRWMKMVELSMRLLVAQKEFGLPYLSEFSSVAVSISSLLCRAEFEHEQLTILKLLIFLKQWRIEDGEKNVQESTSYTPMELLQIFPAINVLSSTSESVKDAVVSFLSTFETQVLNLPFAQRKCQTKISVWPTRCKIGSILLRLLEHLWTEEKDSSCGSCFIDFAFKDWSDQMPNSPKQWLAKLRDYCFITAQQSKLDPSLHHQENVFTGISSLLAAVTSTFIFHPQLTSLAVDSLSSLASMDPKFNVTLLLGNLFYVKIFSTSGTNSARDLIKLLEMLPLLASSSAMVPLILQILLPMLRDDANSVLYAMAVRLLCKTWMRTERVFETLQTILEPGAFSKFSSQKDVCISIAASIRDVCRHNPDRGVDLILSVSSSVESRDSSVQALGFEAISHLCEADVIDFYTAWYVIEKHVLDYSEDPVVALGLCTLLRWGALDAEASPEASVRIIQILWQVGIITKSHPSHKWVKARISALRSLKCFEVEHIIKAVPDFAAKTLEFLMSDDNLEIQRATEDLVVRISNFEHVNRRRAVKERKPVTHKVEKLLDIFPNAIFSSGGKQKLNVGESPGAALLSVTLSSKDHLDASKLHGKYEAMLLEISQSLHIQRNIFVALLAFQSWKSFLDHWLMAVTDTGASIVLKILLRIADESIPRVAENIALAIGALCLVLPPSGYSVLLEALSFLMKWLFQYEHEQRQWAVSISLGLVSNSLHITDKSRKFDIINGLLEVLQNSRSYHVKGACGTGLGLTCQNLLTQVDDHSERTEAKLLGKIIWSLSSTITQISPSSSTPLVSLCKRFPMDQDKAQTETLKDFPCHHGSEDIDDFCGGTGLVLGLGNTVSALYRLGSFDSIKIIKNVILSWIPSEDEVLGMPLSAGSCFVLPTVVNFCERAELADIDLPGLLQSFSSLISRLKATEDYGAASQNLFMASSIGAGSLLSFILNEGVHSLKLDDVISMLENMRSLYTHPYPPIIQLGGMLGVVNAFGAGALNMAETYVRPSLRMDDISKDASYVRGPICGTPVLEPLCTSLIQEMFVIAKESEDKQVRRNSMWSISFLRHWWQSKDSKNIQELRSVSENTLVWGLCSWLNGIEMNDLPNESSIASALRCLSQAPRLPSSIDWGPIIKRLMRHGSNIICEESLSFSLAHANANNSLMLFLDELVLWPRIGTLQLNLQCFLLSHLSEFMNLFSSSRLERFYGDLIMFFSSSPAYMLHGTDERTLLRISLWKGLHQCLVNTSQKSTLSLQVEKCIGLLFRLLPFSHFGNGSEEVRVGSQELMETVSCLSVAPRDLLMNLLQVQEIELLSLRNHLEAEEIKKVIITSRLVQKGYLPLSDLGKMKTFILNSKTEGTWNVLLEVVAALYDADVSVKRQWVLDAVEISCISSHPTTALQFVGLLSGRCCDYMPLLILTPEAVLTGLPLTLPSILSVSSWSFISEKLVEMLWVSTKRICNWASQQPSGNGSYGPAQIDQSQSRWSSLLTSAMRETCLSLKHYLPFEKRLALACLSLP